MIKVHLVDPRSGRGYESVWAEQCEDGTVRLRNEPVEYPTLHWNDVVVVETDAHGRTVTYAESRYPNGIASL